MKFYAASAALALVLGLTVSATAEGSRQPAGGAHMSSFVHHPYHDPRSLHSQRRATGQILGQPMLSERAGAHRAEPRAVEPRLVAPHWASGWR
ncbi:hypothetical protein U8607_08270 [Methylobacterium durans]|uniref:hypothetical protein n=1 Tax=Methylobacterium durans TaxID=2202825 RepID=UPI002AFFD71D|nr:hypothetical protein [Methylobacterium durans]MEA1832076.1 hypothetical protein [Methylobacterium durans]